MFYDFASNLRDALPNASFIGFIGFTGRQWGCPSTCREYDLTFGRNDGLHVRKIPVYPG